MSTQKCGLTLIAARLEKVTSGDVWTVPVPGASLKTLFLPFSEHSGTLIEFKYLGVENKYLQTGKGDKEKCVCTPGTPTEGNISSHKMMLWCPGRYLMKSAN
ncbi:hypothetical protein RUM44_002402 [Polyplax serrata]|uniref:Uncharacterized protein n=1 Tax=Polyplax serrata TaxID=468196 RepID=A0ABR1AER0_POLSC